MDPLERINLHLKSFSLKKQLDGHIVNNFTGTQSIPATLDWFTIYFLLKHFGLLLVHVENMILL